MQHSLFCPCPSCVEATLLLIAFGVVGIGGGLGIWLLLRPYLQTMPRHWGWPRYLMTDLVLLGAMSWWTFALGKAASTHYEPNHVATCTILLLALTAYLWLRFLWLLDYFGAVGFWKRFLFVTVLVPLMMLAGVIGLVWVLYLIAAGSLALYVSNSSVGRELVCSTGVALVVGLPLIKLVQLGLEEILGPPDRSKRSPTALEAAPDATIPTKGP